MWRGTAIFWTSCTAWAASCLEVGSLNCAAGDPRRRLRQRAFHCKRQGSESLLPALGTVRRKPAPCCNPPYPLFARSCMQTPMRCYGYCSWRGSTLWRRRSWAA